MHSSQKHVANQAQPCHSITHSIRSDMSTSRWDQMPVHGSVTISISGYETRQDIYYRNITSTIVWPAVSKKTLVEACQIYSITNQILYYKK